LQALLPAAVTASMPVRLQGQATSKKMIGIQVARFSFFDEGAEKVLDEFQQDRR